MEQSRLERINQLAHKQKTVGLTPEEEKEQDRLRGEYLAAVKRNIIMQLDNTYIVDEKGNEHKLRKKKDNG